MAEKYLRTEHLNFYYAKTQVLFDINVDFKKQHTTALIGPSGSGKSTLLRSFNRIYAMHTYQRATGKILLEGEDILADDIDLNSLRREIGMVFQKPTPFPMSIFNNIAYALKLHEKLSKADLAIRVEEALKQAALWNEVKDKLHDAGTHLSGGQQQRLSIARTIAIKPKILLLDEPTSALDPISASKVEDLIKELEKEFTTIIVTHNLAQAKRLSQETVFMMNGEIVEHADTHQLFNNPQDKRTENYISNH